MDLRNLTRAELTRFLRDDLAEARYRADQLFRWVHARGAVSFDEMSDLGRELRATLAEVAALGTLAVDTVRRAADGTRKLRLRTHDGLAVECVLIPDGAKLTLCLSSQAGCALGCAFCATAALGLRRNLTAGEIADQVYRARALLEREEPGRRITNLVYMGMGEPLHNYDQVMRSIAILTDGLGANFSLRRVTVSTAGLVPGIERLGRDGVRVNLAVSLNATTDEVRRRLMPIDAKWPIARLLAAVRAFPLERRRRVTFEYVLLAGVNDTDGDAARLARLLRGLPCKVNLIPWNPHPGAPFARPSPAAVERFQQEVKRRGLPAYLRAPRGDDIEAACGQLAGVAPAIAPTA